MTERKSKGIQADSRTIRTAIAALGILVLMTQASAKTSSTDVFVAKASRSHPSGRINLILKTSGEMSVREEKALTKLGGYIYNRLPIIKSLAVNVPVKNLRDVLLFPSVVHASEDMDTCKTDAFTVGSSGADVAWSQYRAFGTGVGIALLDSGVRDNPDFDQPLLGKQGSLLGSILPTKRIKAQVNFTKEDSNDHCGHGTHVAGIIAGNAAQSYDPCKYTQSFFGVAPNANIISVKVLDRLGSGTVSQTIAALQWCIDNKTKYNIRVINMSLGHPVGESYTTDPLCQAAEAAWKSGIVVVCAAGNDGRSTEDPDPNVTDNEGYGTAYGSINSPANSPYVITVGAMKSTDGTKANDRIATYSGRGPSRVDFVLKPDLVAPGNRVISTQPKDDSYLATSYPDQVGVFRRDYVKGVKSNDKKLSDQYFRLSGTSMAAPVVSAAAAIMLDADPSLSPDTIKARLMVSADKWTDADGNGDACTYGAGYINIPAALGSTVVARTYALSPSLSRDEDGNVRVNLDPAIWGDRAMWGTGTIEDLRAIWGERALWGNAICNGRALWGNMMAPKVGRAMWGNDFWDRTTIKYINTGGLDLSSGSVSILGEK